MRSLFVFAANKTGESLVCHPMTAEGRIYIILSQDGYRSQKNKNGGTQHGKANSKGRTAH